MILCANIVCLLPVNTSVCLKVCESHNKICIIKVIIINISIYCLWVATVCWTLRLDQWVIQQLQLLPPFSAGRCYFGLLMLHPILCDFKPPLLALTVTTFLTHHILKSARDKGMKNKAGKHLTLQVWSLMSSTSPTLELFPINKTGCEIFEIVWIKGQMEARCTVCSVTGHAHTVIQLQLWVTL